MQSDTYHALGCHYPAAELDWATGEKGMAQPERLTSGERIAQTGAREASASPVTLGVILGIGIAGTLDEVILHQLLQWHNYYVHTTESGRIISDGLFHLFSSACLALGALLLWRRRHAARMPGDSRLLASGILLGLGGFNLFDGTIQHKLLGLHQVREGVANTLPYDLAFIGIALTVFVAGWLLRRSVRRSRT